MFEKILKNRPILLLSFGHGLVDFYISLLPAVAPSLALYLDAPLGSVVALFGLGSLVCNAIQPLAGYFMSKRNMSWLLWVGVLLSVLPCFMGWTSGFTAMAILVLVGSAGTGLFHPEGVLSAHDATGDKAYLGVPLFMAGGFCIGSLSAPAGIQCVKYLGYPWLALLAIPGIVVAAILFTLRRNQKRDHPSVAFKARSRRMSKKGEGRMSYFPLLAVATCLSLANSITFAILASHYELLFGASARSLAGWSLLLFGAGGSLASFLWSSMSKQHGFYRVVLMTQIFAAPLFAYVAYAASPIASFFVYLPLSLVSSASIYPVSVSLAKSASGLTQSMRAALLMGGNACLSSIFVMAAGALLDRGLDSHYIMLAPAAASLIAILIAAWQLFTRAAGSRAVTVTD